MLRPLLASISLLAPIILACAPFTEPTPNIQATVEAVVETKVATFGPAPALSPSGAMSILRHYLLDCIEDWRQPYVAKYLSGERYRTPPPPVSANLLGKDVSWWRALATGDNAQVVWSARFVERIADPYGDVQEKWSVVGAGLEPGGSGLVPAPGTWLVTAGRKRPWPLDGPANLAWDKFSNDNRFCR